VPKLVLSRAAFSMMFHYENRFSVSLFKVSEEGYWKLSQKYE
jgi:hypothetical protein